jgi:sugar transferase (PEP-CTERM/EpsH1 system associated)
MKLLWVKAGGLVPPDIGGKIRSYNILRELTKSHSVTLFTFYTAHTGDMHQQLEGVFDKVVCCPMHIATNRTLAEFMSFVGHMFSSWPHTVSKYCRPEVATAVRKLVADENYDAIVCDFSVAAAVIPWDLPCPKLMFTHNVEALIWRRHFEVSRNPLWKLVSFGEYQKMLRFERYFLQKSDHVLTVSEADREFFSRFVDAAKITVISTGVDTEYYQASAAQERPDSLVFTGSMDWMPNQDGVLYFLRSVLPLIRREIPEVKFSIVGRQPSEKLREIANATSGVQVTGRVDDIRPFVHEASVYVVPLRIGSGTRLKIFEAMSMGKAIVSTTLGAAGLPVNNGKDIFLADTPEELARKVVLLLRDRTERARLGAAARRLVEQRYSWTSVAAEFDGVLRHMLLQENPHKDYVYNDVATARGAIQ